MSICEIQRLLKLQHLKCLMLHSSYVRGLDDLIIGFRLCITYYLSYGRLSYINLFILNKEWLPTNKFRKDPRKQVRGNYILAIKGSLSHGLSMVWRLGKYGRVHLPNVVAFDPDEDPKITYSSCTPW